MGLLCNGDLTDAVTTPLPAGRSFREAVWGVNSLTSQISPTPHPPFRFGVAGSAVATGTRVCESGYTDSILQDRR